MERSSSQSKNAPYARKDGRKSFFSKMKDTMRDMLSPSWLTDRKSEESAPREFAGGTMGDPGVPMSQPGMPRMQGVDMQSTSGSYKPQPAFLGNGQPRTADFVGLNPVQETAQSGMMMPAFQPTMFPPPISEFTSAQLPLARLTEKSDSVMAHEDTMSQRSDGSKSTSGCSSMIPQTEVSQKDNVTEKRKASEPENASCSSPHEQPSVKRQKLQSGSSLNTTFTRRLSDTLLHRQGTSNITNRPAFNASLFDSPLRNESSILGTSFHESSFYPGKTTFGGRSSLSFRSNRKKTDLNQSLPSRLSMPVKVFMKAKPRVNANKEAVTSSTAKRILEALDKMPTPLNDAKRIPVAAPRQWSESPSFFSRNRMPSQSRSGPPTQKLNVSAQASISKNRQVSFAPVVQSKSAASEPAAFEKPSIPTRQDTVVISNEPAVGSGKMRRDKSYHRGSASFKPTLEEEDTVILPNLQTDYTLPVSSMPQFNFSTPVTQQRTKTSDTSTPVGQDSSKKPAFNFTFSSPIHEEVPANKPASPQKFSGFQFSSPISLEKTSTDKSEPANNKPFSSTVSSGSTNNAPFSFAPPSSKTMSVESNFSVAPKPKPKLNGPTESPKGGFAVASELKQGSVMDILGGGGFSKPTTTTKTDSNLFGKQTTTATPSGTAPLSELFKSSGWSCDGCLLNNKADATKCVACMTPKPSAAPKAAPATQDSGIVTPKSDLFAKFQQPSGSWACDACLLQNKPEANKCIACQSPKPGGTKLSSPLLAGSVVPGNWICNTCLIQNKKDDTVCGACNTAKSTPAPSSSTKSSDLNKSDSLFSKFKPPSGQWECEVCLVQNKSDVSKCVACQSPKPLKAFKHPPGDWVCDTCLVNNKETDVNCVACNYTRPGAPRTQTVPSIAKSYTSSQASGFSIPKSTGSTSISIASTGGFTFTASSTAETNSSGFNLLPKKDEKKQDSAPLTGGFKFSAPAGETSSGNGFKIGSVSEANSGSGFKFGASSSNKSESNPVSGGFKFGTTLPSNGSSSDTTKDKNNKESSSLTGGFQFGKSTVSSSNSISSSSTPSIGGFTFGQKSDNSSVKESVTTTTSVPGGFSFKSSVTVTSVQSLITSQTSVSSSAGGFNVQTLPVSTVTNSVGLPSVTSTDGFQFVATKLSQSSTSAAISKPTESKPSFGGFSFGQQLSSGTNTSNSTFDSAQKLVSPSKRGRDEDSDEPSTKKASFNFGQSSNASPAFQFGSNNELGVLDALRFCERCGLGPVPLTCYSVINELKRGLSGYLYVKCRNVDSGHVNKVPYGKTHREKGTGAPCFVVNTKLGTVYCLILADDWCVFVFNSTSTLKDHIIPNLANCLIKRPVNKEAGLSPSVHTEKYATKRAKERENHLVVFCLSSAKRKLILKLERSITQGAQEALEGVSYQSDIGFQPDVDIEKLPDPVPRGDFKPVDIGELIPTIVTFDLETTDLIRGGKIPHITQIAAQVVGQSSSFNLYVQPSIPITALAQQITGISIVDEKMFVNGSPVSSVDINEALDSFIDWLGKFPRIILTAHNGRRFDFPVLVSVLSKVNKFNKFSQIVMAFCDSLAVCRKVFPGRSTYKQESLVSDILNITYNAHDAVGDVCALSKLLQHAVSTLTMKDFSAFLFSPSAVFYNNLYLREKAKNISSLKVLISSGICKMATAEIIAGSGLNLDQLKKIYVRDGEDGLLNTFTMKNSLGQPRVTNTERILKSVIPKLAEYFNNLIASSSSSSVFGASQAPASSTSSAGLFMFGQQTSSTAPTKSSSSLFVFGQQNSKPATSVSSTTNSSTFVFGAQNPISSSTTSSSAPVFGQAKSTAVTTSTTGSLFGQFGSTNSSSSAAPSFNFTATSTTQSASQPSAFSSTPSFNFGKTDTTSTGSSSGVFNFGGQPAPATTPAFGSSSSFGSSNTSVFGQSSGITNAFSGNAPSTTPAFGATPPAFGSSNSSTPAAPAFGGVFGNNSQTTAQAPAASNAVFQFGAKPSEPTPAAPTGFNFNSTPAGLGQPSGFNFGGQAQTPGVNVFSATSTGAAAGDGRKIKKAVRKIRR